MSATTDDGRDSRVEDAVSQIWRDVLQVSDEQAASTFFELGGLSVAAVTIVARIDEELGIRVDIAELYEDPDVTAFARVVAARAIEDGSEE